MLKGLKALRIINTNTCRNFFHQGSGHRTRYHHIVGAARQDQRCDDAKEQASRRTPGRAPAEPEEQLPDNPAPGAKLARGNPVRSRTDYMGRMVRMLRTIGVHDDSSRLLMVIRGGSGRWSYTCRESPYPTAASADFLTRSRIMNRSGTFSA